MRRAALLLGLGASTVRGCPNCEIEVPQDLEHWLKPSDLFTYCGQFSGGASIEDIHKPVCARETTLHEQDMKTASHPKAEPMYHILGVEGGPGRRSLGDRPKAPPKMSPKRQLHVGGERGFGSADYPGSRGKVTECFPANLPASVKKDKIHTPGDWEELLTNLHKIRHEACPSDQHLVLAGGHVGAQAHELGIPVLPTALEVQGFNLPLCQCDMYDHPDIHTVEDIEAMYKKADDWASKGEGLNPEDYPSEEAYFAHAGGWLKDFDTTVPTLCMKATQSFYAWDDRATAQRHDDITCYPPNPDYPTVGSHDGGELSFYGCRSDMIACKHGLPDWDLRATGESIIGKLTTDVVPNLPFSQPVD